MTETRSAAKSTLTDEMRWDALKKKTTEVKVSKAFALYRKHGIEPILIKGLAAARYYPESKFRDSIDMDLAVAASDFDTAFRINQLDEANGLAIDLHRELRHLDTCEWEDLFGNSELIQSETGSMRVLRPEDHLRVLCVHWLTDGGSNRERLWDIYYLVTHRSTNFDWNRFLDTVDPDRRRWLVCTLGLAHHFLGLELAGTPVEDEIENIPKWLRRTVEKEWATDTPFRPLSASTHDPRLFLKQLLKRLPPNPICATILMNGRVDAKTRIFYQIGTSLKRIGPSIRNIVSGLYNVSK